METTFNGVDEPTQPWQSATTKKVFVLVLPPRSEVAGPRNKRTYGFAIRGPWVTAVTPGSVAWTSGMREGQKIISVGGENVRGDGTRQVLARLQHHSKKPVHLLVEDPMETKLVVVGESGDEEQDNLEQLSDDHFSSRNTTLDRKSPGSCSLSRNDSPKLASRQYGYSSESYPPGEVRSTSQYGFSESVLPRENFPQETDPFIRPPSNGRPRDGSQVDSYNDTVVTLQANKITTQPLSYRANGPDPPPKVQTYLLFAALVTALCNPIIGGFSLHHSLRARAALRRGVMKDVDHHRDRALLFGVLALVIGLSVWALTFTFIWVITIWKDGI